MKLSTQHGFTLVELMISIVLGLMVTAAAAQLFITGQRSVALQQGAAGLQNSGSFGLEYILRDVRLANLGASTPAINPTVLHGGLVLSSANLSTTAAADFKITGASSDNSLMTAGEMGLSNLNSQKSDQLVIQYKNTVNNKYDCEGKSISPNHYIVQRYFLREDSNNYNDPNKALALACKATSYTGDGNTVLANLNGNGEIIIPRVDHMHILLGVARDSMNSGCTAAADQDGQLDCFGYIKINDYLALTVKPQIISIKMGLLVRSTDSVGKHDLTTAGKKYKIYDIDQPLTDDDKNNLYVREVVTQTVALRNGFGLQEEPK